MRRCWLVAAALTLTGAPGAAADATTDAMVRVLQTVCLGSSFDPDVAKTKLRALGWRPIDPVLLDPNPADSNTWVGGADGIGLRLDVSRLSLFVCSVRGATSDFAGLKSHLDGVGGRVLLDEDVGGLRMISRALRLDGVAVSLGATVDGTFASLIVSEEAASR